MAVCIQTAFVADTDGAAVERTTMGSDFQQAAVLADAAVPTDVEMITDGAKATGFVIAQKLFYRIVAVATCSGTVQNDVAYGVDGVH